MWNCNFALFILYIIRCRRFLPVVLSSSALFHSLSRLLVMGTCLPVCECVHFYSFHTHTNSSSRTFTTKCMAFSSWENDREKCASFNMTKCKNWCVQQQQLNRYADVWRTDILETRNRRYKLKMHTNERLLVLTIEI